MEASKWSQLPFLPAAANLCEKPWTNDRCVFLRSGQREGARHKVFLLSPWFHPEISALKTSGQLVCFVASDPCFVVLALELAGAKKQGAPPPLACLLELKGPGSPES